MKKLSCLLFLLMVSLSMMANPITQRQAKLKAMAFASSHMRMANANANLAYRSHQNTENGNVYIYNIGEKEGFVVVSGDDRTESILGYVDEGTFDSRQMPESMMAWLKNYEEYLDGITIQRGSPRMNTSHPAVVVEPMITTKWGQRAPYNSMCPTVYGIVTPTGCTATALSQVMRYHRYPVDACETLPAYTTNSSKIKMPELEGKQFNWDNMPDEITADSPQDYIDAISELMLYVGQAHDMNYMSSGSGAYTTLIPTRLPKYFGYANTMHYVYRRSYTEQEWDSLLVKELINNRPIIYTAYNNVGQGHTFICDGYDGNGLYHINWGWNGVGNGYFRISEAFSTDENLSSNVKNYHLSMEQTAILGLQPSGTDDFVAPKDYVRAFSRPSLKNGSKYSRTDNSSNFTGITIKQWISNTTNTKKSYSYGMAICDENDQIVKVLGNTSASLNPDVEKSYELTNLSMGMELADGHYTIKGIYKRSTKSDWMVMGGTDNNYIDMVVDGLEMTLTSMPKADFIVKDIRREDSFVVLELENPSQDFFGPIYIRKYNPTTEKIDKITSDYIAFDASSSEDFDLYVEDGKNLDIYNDIFYLSVDEYDTQYFYSSLSTTPIDIQKSFEIINVGDEPLTVVGDRIMLRLTLENKSLVDYDNYITTELVGETDEAVAETISEVVKLDSKKDMVLMYEIPLSDYEQTYRIRVTHKKNLTSWESDSITGITVSKGAIYWNKNGEIKTKLAAAKFEVPEDALAINVRSAYTSNVTANSNPNTIYMLGSTLPKGLAGKNYVNSSNKGSNLVLTDSCDYYIPCELSFSGKVSYTRTISEDDSLRWDALTLPFSPKEVTVDSENIQWYKTADDEEGNFWMMEFDGMDNDSIVTKYAEQIEAYTPYLIATPQQLAGKTLSFEASKISVAPTEDVIIARGDTILHGTHCMVNEPGTYILSEGNFIYVEEGADVPAFRAYLSLGTLPEEIVTTIGVAPCLIQPEDTNPVDPPTLKGDVNGDGVVSVIDVVTLVNYIIGQNPSVFIKANADMDDDGKYSISDVVMVVNLLTSQPAPSDDNPEGGNTADDNADGASDDNPEGGNTADDNADGTSDDNPEDGNTADDNADVNPSDDTSGEE